MKALNEAGADLSRSAFLTALSTIGTVDFGGAVLAFGPDDNQGMDDVFLTRITADGGFETITD